MAPYMRDAILTRRTLTGAWIETVFKETFSDFEEVAPSRVRGLKQELMPVIIGEQPSHPHGCVD